jgi:hypothetical protein
VVLILDAEKTIGDEGMISLLRIILFATRNYTAAFQGTYKSFKRNYRSWRHNLFEKQLLISVLLGHSVGPARRETSV